MQEQVDRDPNWEENELIFPVSLHYAWMIKDPGRYLVCEKYLLANQSPQNVKDLKRLSEAYQLMRESGCFEYTDSEAAERYDSIVKEQHPEYLTDERLRKAYIFMHPLQNSKDPASDYYLSPDEELAINRDLTKECEEMEQCWYKAVGWYGHTPEA